MADTAQLPLLGVIMCCTSIPPEQRENIASIAQQMGASHKFDLTSDVTHLIVGDYDTPKYKFVAKERSDVKVMLPSWIEAVRASWLEGGTTDVTTAEREHKLPTYHGLRICVTGFDDLAYRKKLEDEIVKAGGSYSGNLTKEITHLIAKKPGSEKYEYAKHKDIKTVSIEWHVQSLDRGMILDEALYNPLLPAAERGQGAWVRRVPSTTSLGKRARESDGGSQNARKLRRTASAKFETHNESLWGDIVGGGVKMEKATEDDWDASAHPVENKHSINRKIVSLDDRVTTLSAEDEKQSLKRSQSLSSLEALLAKPTRTGGIFYGKTFLLRGFDDKKETILRRHLQSHGAIVNDSNGEISTNNAYFLVPHTMPTDEAYQLMEESFQRPPVTELWVERCLHRKQFVEPDEHMASKPFKNFPISGFQKLNVSSTGFQGIDLLHISKVVKLMGGTYHEFFTEKASVLLRNNVAPGHDKLQHAQLWSVPTVRVEWLWDCVRVGKLLAFDDFLVQPVGVSAPNLKTTEDSKKDAESSKAEAKPFAERVSMELPLGRSLLSREKFKHPKNQPREAKPLAVSTKSLKSPFPDDAGPLPILDDATPFPDDPPTASAKRTPSTHLAHEKRNPLHEITPNSSPPKPSPHKASSAYTTTLPSKPLSPTQDAGDDNDDHDDDHDTLGPAISSLLLQHQASRSSSTTITTAATAPTTKPIASSKSEQPLRRRRQLFGRAPSNLSSHSINLSRASSVDTLNTDGLGTPLEAIHSNPKSTIDTKGTKPESRPIYDHDDPDKPNEDHLQMTQLGYEDPNVAAWRERVAIKMAGGKIKEGTTPGRKVERAKARGDGEGLGISKRTRLAVGGR